MSSIVLEPKYYLHHFEELTHTVLSKHAHLLEECHHNYLKDYQALSEDARCLLIRLLNRTGILFSKKTIIYQEIVNLEESWQELHNSNFVRPLGQQDLEDYLHWIKKEVMSELLLGLNVPFKKSSSREVLKRLLLSHKEQLWSALSDCEDTQVLTRSEDIEYIFFLYFGKLQTKLILPTLRDLGIRPTNKGASFKAKFNSKEEARDHYFYQSLKHKDKKAPLTLSLDEISSWPRPTLQETLLLRETLLLNQASRFKEADPHSALEILKLATTHPATEKRARLYYELGLREECLKELERIFDDPYNDEELLFAEDFLARKFNQKRVSHLTETLRSAPKLAIDESFYRHPEIGVIAHYEELGLTGHFSENELWQTLFWTFFAEELSSSLHSEFDNAPSDLVEKVFYAKNEEIIHQKLNALTRESLLELFSDNEMVRAFVGVAPLESVKSMLVYMAQDYYQRNSGYPDIFIIENDQLTFYEIKAPGDSLKASQIKQLRSLEKAGLNVNILQVEYQFNENQVYVVVDLETTGSLSSWNRITEIGAVKMRGKEIIDTFQTLINPRRSIPFDIQKLTGITNEMVKNAPYFEEKAQEFLAFCEDAIFVAHNVSFDYGFLQSEFKRLEQKFTRPYICTKAWMKKYYPGPTSYGLKNLCLHFNIALENHHRALSDAQAAAQLLVLINEKRKG